MEVNQMLLNAVQDGIRDGIKSKLDGYNSPLAPMIADCLKQHDGQIRSLIGEALRAAFDDAAFRKTVIDGVNHKLGSLLVARFGGELERQVNQLKSDPDTRARITLAIEDIVKGSK